MPDSVSFPSDDDCHALVAHLQFPAIRDRLIADIPGLNGPLQDILFAHTDAAPKWSRIGPAPKSQFQQEHFTSGQHFASRALE